jgi:hypothetical protein
MLLTEKQRERIRNRISSNDEKIGVLETDNATLKKSLADDETARLKKAVDEKGLTIESAIGIIAAYDNQLSLAEFDESAETSTVDTESVTADSVSNEGSVQSDETKKPV